MSGFFRELIANKRIVRILGSYPELEERYAHGVKSYKVKNDPVRRKGKPDLRLLLVEPLRRARSIDKRAKEGALARG